MQYERLGTNTPTTGVFFGRRHEDFRTSQPPVVQWPDYLTGQVNKPLRVLVIDDDAHIRHVISHELLKDLRTHLVAQAGSLREGRRLISQYDFDVMLVDLNLGDGLGFELIGLMKRIRPKAEAVVVSAMEDENSALQAFELGATGYLVKSAWFGNFPQALLEVANGGASISPGLARRLLQKFRISSPAVQATMATPNEHLIKEPLTKREEEVLKGVSAGFTTAEISHSLTISSQTVNTHIKNIYRKLQIHSRAEATACVARGGLR